MDYSSIKPDVLESISDYVNNRIPPGDFLQAVLENNLKESFNRADEDNIRSMFKIVQFIYNEIPARCWGSPEKVKKWLGEGGTDGSR